MPTKKKTMTKKKTTKKGGRSNSSKGESRTPNIVYVFFALVFGIFLFAIYYDNVNKKPQKNESVKKEEPKSKEQPKKEQKIITKPRIVQKKPGKIEPIKKAAERPVERASELKKTKINHQEQQLIAKKTPVTIPEPKDVDFPSHKGKKTTPDKTYREPVFWPQVAIVIDDMGTSKKGASELFKIKANLTFSILPGQPYSKWVAIEAHKRGHHIMAHVPMEPKDLNNNLGQGGLLLSMSSKEIQLAFNDIIDSIPYVVGFNNHMGSAFTTDINAMKAVMSATNGKNLFFLDSRTIPNSVGVSVAKANGIRAYGRDIFLDHKDTPEFIEKQWNNLVKIAKKRGQAIAIAHPYKNTIAFLQKTLPSDRVDVVPVSYLKTYQ